MPRRAKFILKMEESGGFLEIVERKQAKTAQKGRLVGQLWIYEFSKARIVCIGPDWPYAVVTFALIACIAGLYALAVMPSTPAALQPFSWLFVVPLPLSYLCLFLSNPGVPDVLLQGDLASAGCPSCGAPSHPGRQHCSVCAVCIDGFDHHCPFAGKCIGEGNKRVFVCFVGSLYAAVLGVVLWGIFVAEHPKGR